MMTDDPPTKHLTRVMISACLPETDSFNVSFTTNILSNRRSNDYINSRRKTAIALSVAMFRALITRLVMQNKIAFQSNADHSLRTV